MRTTILALGLILTASFVFADDKKSGNELKVKINHEYKYDSESTRTRTIQFKYDTKEWLQITKKPESSDGIYLRRNEVAKFKAIVEKMLKFGNVVYDNQITGVKKTFKGEKAILPQNVFEFTYIDIAEDVSKPFGKDDIRVLWGVIRYPGSNSLTSQQWDFRDLEEIAKVFDERQKEVFKKYDLLKALND